jgi:stage II sporulation protein AA (anti-sigma F factor antagonist)
MFKKNLPLIFEVSMENDIAIIKLGGRLDSTNVQDVTEKFDSIVDAKSNKVILDLSKLDYISSIWLSEFMNFSRYIASKDGEVILINMDKKIQRVFDVLGFSDNFIILDSEEEAITRLKSK